MSVIPNRVPPLRERPEDIPALVRHFTELFSREDKRRPARFTPGAVEWLQKARWKGNIREPKNTVERLLIMTPRSYLYKKLEQYRISQDTDGWIFDTFRRSRTDDRPPEPGARRAEGEGG